MWGITFFCPYQKIQIWFRDGHIKEAKWYIYCFKKKQRFNKKVVNVNLNIYLTSVTINLAISLCLQYRYTNV